MSEGNFNGRDALLRHQTDRGHVKSLEHIETDSIRFKIRSRNAGEEKRTRHRLRDEAGSRRRQACDGERKSLTESAFTDPEAITGSTKRFRSARHQDHLPSRSPPVSNGFR